ncbi:unnamed protein product [marine sediment metagenome]|jgi:uncharacterized protein YndB with AHSA1/START domain|uniref:Coenzyme Q-binding protein COQ10 START domain-containing protein n=1 Tax=marine sediment metagenome TaxID=412755 RepID=X1BSX9_9ZZZZ
MPLCKRLELSHSIEIKTTPEKIWNFLKNPENYTIWHPQDHIKVIWTEGKPFEVGSKFYSEQRVFGKVQKYNAKIQEIIPNRKIVFTFKFPVSLISPEIEWRIEPKGSNTVFTAISYLRAGYLLKKVFKKGMNKLIEEHNRHVGEEGENLKKLLEGD